MKKVEKVWGQELWIHNSSGYCSKILYLKRKYRCSLHFHKKKIETFFCHSGKVELEYTTTGHTSGRDKKEDYEIKKIKLKPGDWVQVKPLILHRFYGLRNSIIFEASSTHFESDSYRLEMSGKI